jgi:methylated-DNA-[protein]-cysteine S-methyltransferase
MILATTIAGPAGPVHLALTSEGVLALELTTTEEAFVAGLARRRPGQPTAWIEDPAATAPSLDAVVRTLEGALGGEPAALESLSELPLDLADRPAWDRAVLDAVRAIPRGEVRSYGQIARAIGRPGAARAVGGAVGRNPVALLVPCHRVVAGDGTLGGYGGGWWGDHERLLELKAALLEREGISLPRSRVVARR